MGIKVTNKNVDLTTKKIGSRLGRMSLYVDEQRKNRTLEGEERNQRANLNLPKFLFKRL